MNLPLRDITSLSLPEVRAKAVYAIRRRVGRPPELAAARVLAAGWADRTIPTDGPKVLLFTPRDWAFHVHTEAVLGHALRLRGAQVSVLGCGGGLEVCDHNNCHRAPPMPCGSCTTYATAAAAAHGLDRRVLTYPDPAPWPELDDLDVDELYEVEWDGLPLGRLSIIPSQWFNMTTRIHEDPLTPVNVRRFLRSGRRIAAALSVALDEEPPDLVFMLNGTFIFESIMWELCRRRSIPVVNYEVGFVADSLVAYRDEPACYYDQTAWWDQEAARPLTPHEDQRLTAFLADRRRGGHAADATAAELVANGNDPRTGSAAVLFTNVTWDSAVIGRQAAFEDIQQWISTTIRSFAARPEHQLVIRLHPAETRFRGKNTREPLGDFIDATFPELPPNVRLVRPDDTDSSYDLMDAADVGLVYTSTTGLELALSGTPVLVSGETHYRGRGFTVDATSPEDYDRRLGEMLDEPSAWLPDVERARRYANLFFFGSPYDLPLVTEPTLGIPHLEVQSLDELEPGRSTELDAFCDGILGRVPFGPTEPTGPV